MNHRALLEDNAVFTNAIESIRATDFRSELLISEIPAPQNVAQETFALAASVQLEPRMKLVEDPEFDPLESVYGSGRFALFYDPANFDVWGSDFRVVSFVSAPYNPILEEDAMLQEVCWTWLEDALKTNNAKYTASAGTVTKSTSMGFGSLAEQGEGGMLEIRASWSVTDDNFPAHAKAWSQLICSVAGLPDEEGVASLDAFRMKKMSTSAHA